MLTVKEALDRIDLELHRPVGNPVSGLEEEPVSDQLHAVHLTRPLDLESVYCGALRLSVGGFPVSKTFKPMPRMPIATLMLDAIILVLFIGYLTALTKIKNVDLTYSSGSGHLSLCCFSYAHIWFLSTNLGVNFRHPVIELAIF